MLQKPVIGSETSVALVPMNSETNGISMTRMNGKNHTGFSLANLSNYNGLDTSLVIISSPYCIKNVVIRFMPFLF